MRVKVIRTRPDGVVYVRASLREGSVPLERMLGAEETQQSWLATNPNVLASDGATEVSTHKQRKISKLRCLMRHHRQKKSASPVG